MVFYPMILRGMSRVLFIYVFLLLGISFRSYSLFDDSDSTRLFFKGQLSGWGHVNPENSFPFLSGLRYIPRLNFETGAGANRKIDFEASANLYGTFGLDPFVSAGVEGDFKPYRVWARYSTRQFEFRVGLQKINFGSASMLRPLMWFDQVDPRDPLRLTDGVWGALARYYFLNNANVWLWGLYGNKNPKGWEAAPTASRHPEFGGRIQVPVPRGEAAFSFHHRKTFEPGTLYDIGTTPVLNENRVGLDLKADMVVGCWIEGSWVSLPKAAGKFRNQKIINLGVDYTFGIGNGLMAAYEHLLVATDESFFAFKQNVSFSLLNLTYPIGMFDNLSAIVFYDWTHKSVYNFINWQKQFKRIVLYVMGYINPRDYKIPTQQGAENLLAGSGVQVMVVFNY